jgi:transcriptional regulator with PAS, ATPase and Fis domain
MDVTGIGGIIGIITAIYAFYKWLKPSVMTYYEIHKFNYTVGHTLMKDIERKLGKTAAQNILDFMASSSNDRKTYDIRLDRVENAIGMGIYVADSKGKCIYANSTLSNMFGMDKEDMLNSGWLRAVIDREKSYSRWKFCIDNRVPYNDTYEILVDGVIKKCYTEAEAILVDDVVIGYVGTTSEIKPVAIV